MELATALFFYRYFVVMLWTGGARLQINLPQKYFSKVIRAVVEFDMIQDGDKIKIDIPNRNRPTPPSSDKNSEIVINYSFFYRTFPS